MLVDHDLGEGLGQLALMLAVIFWMYGGYAWLTNQIATDRALHRGVLVAGMAGYLVLALAIPDAFGDAGTAFGLAYLAVVLVHAGLFSRAPSEGARRGIRAIAPFNLATAALVLAGGLAGGTAQYVLWAVAAVAEWVTPRLVGVSSFEVDVAHFVERHGLVVIVAIGESVVAIGIGAEGLAVDVGLAAVAVLGLLLSTCLWWAYFGGDDVRAEHAMAAAAGPRRARMAVDGFGYAHLALLAGIIVVAAGIKAVLAHPGDELEAKQAVQLAGGAALFMAGDVLFRRVMGIAQGPWRALAAVAVLVSIPVGLELSAAAQLVVVVAVLGAALAAEARSSPPRAAVA